MAFGNIHWFIDLGHSRAAGATLPLCHQQGTRDSCHRGSGAGTGGTGLLMPAGEVAVAVAGAVGGHGGGTGGSGGGDSDIGGGSGDSGGSGYGDNNDGG